MESFIYSDLNRACRQKDKSKIQYFGAFAAAFSYIIYYANKNRRNQQLKGNNMLYRGLNLGHTEVTEYKPGTKTNLKGYVSTSLELQNAI